MERITTDEELVPFLDDVIRFLHTLNTPMGRRFRYMVRRFLVTYEPVNELDLADYVGEGGKAGE